jgi:hypothetical protein
VQKVIGIIVAVVVGVVAYFVGFRASSGLFGAGIEAKVLPEPSVTSGWQKVEPAGGNYSMQIPSDMTVFDPKDPQLEAILKAGGELNPQFESTVQQMMANGNLSFMAMDLKNPANAGQNVNVLLLPKRGKIRKQQSELDAYKKQMESEAPTGSRLISAEFYELPIGTAIRSELSMQIQSLVGPAHLLATGYIVVGKDHMYEVTFTSPEQGFEELDAMAKRAMETFRIKG